MHCPKVAASWSRAVTLVKKEGEEENNLLCKKKIRDDEDHPVVFSCLLIGLFRQVARVAWQSQSEVGVFVLVELQQC